MENENSRSMTFVSVLWVCLSTPLAMAMLISLRYVRRRHRSHERLSQVLHRSRDNPEMVRLCSIAITEAQTAQMWAVKAVTWRG